MRASQSKPRARKHVVKKQSLRKNLLLLFLSLLFLAGTSRLFFLAKSQHLYQPLEWRINKISMKTPEPAQPKKQLKEVKETPKVAASGMDYLFWKILRDEQPEKDQ